MDPRTVRPEGTHGKPIFESANGARPPRRDAKPRHAVNRKKHLEEEMLQAIFENIPVMISCYDDAGRLLQANRAWQATLGWTVAEAQRVDIVAQAYPEPEIRKSVIDFMSRCENRWADFATTTRDGRVLQTSWARFELSDGSRIGFGLDLTDRRKSEAERDRLLQSETQARGEAENTLRRLHAIQTITDSALLHLDVDDLLRELLSRLRQTLDGEAATVMLVDDRNEYLYPRAWTGETIPDIASLRVVLGKGMSGRVASEGRPLIVNDVAILDLSGISGHLHPDQMAARALIGAPLEVRDRVIGAVLVTARHPRQFTEQDLEVICLVADRVAPVIERARLVEDARASHERLAALSRRLLTAHEEERRRLAVELHDELGQVLTAVKINLESLARSTPGLPPQLTDAIGSVDHALHRVRDLALDLRPSVLDDLGLPPALRWYVDRFARDANVEVHVAVDALEDIETGMATACFRVAQEALTNVARHARASQVWLDLHARDQGLELGIRDDGVGFDAVAARERATHGASMGLLGMQERVSLAGGQMEIRRPTGGGTEVWARFPLRYPNRRTP